MLRKALRGGLLKKNTREQGKKIWSEAQRARYINVDEISFSLGYGDNGVGAEKLRDLL
jgi:hypothetical protein